MGANLWWKGKLHPSIVKNDGYNKLLSQNRWVQISIFQNWWVHLHPLTRPKEGPGHYWVGMRAASSIVPKFWKPLAAVVFEIFSKKNFWVVFGPIWVTQLKEFKKSPKKRRFEIFQLALESRWKLSSSCFRTL